jgi:hypothetical protein
MGRIFTIILVAASLAASLSACSTEVWRKAGASEEDATLDTAACQIAARRTTDGANVVYGKVYAYNYFNNCMASRGYQVSVF